MAQATSRAIPKEPEVLGWMESLSNWGRWGEDDQLGCRKCPVDKAVGPFQLPANTCQGFVLGF